MDYGAVILYYKRTEENFDIIKLLAVTVYTNRIYLIYNIEFQHRIFSTENDC